MGLWNSYWRLAHSRDEFDALMALPIEADGGEKVINLSNRSNLNITVADQTIITIDRGMSILFRDEKFGLDARKLFLELIQITPNQDLKVNGIPIEQYQQVSYAKTWLTSIRPDHFLKVHWLKTSPVFNRLVIEGQHCSGHTSLA